MDVPAPGPSQCVVGLTIPVPEPWAAQVRTVRAGVGDPLAGVVPAHITLVPPTAVERAALPTIREHVERVAARSAPFPVHARGVGTFRPVSPVVYVALVVGAEACASLQHALRADGGPLAGSSRFPFHPHITLAQEVGDAALDAAAREGAGIDADFVVEQIRLHQLADGCRWRLLMAPALTAPPVPRGSADPRRGGRGNEPGPERSGCGARPRAARRGQ